MNKLFKKVLFFLSLFLLPLSAIFISFANKNNQYQSQKNSIVSYETSEPELMMSTANINTTNVDWSGFNDVNLQYPTWQGDITIPSGWSTINYVYLLLFDKTNMEVPIDDPLAFNTIWNHTKVYNILNLGTTSSSTVSQNDWIVSNAIDWNATLEYQLAYMYIEMNTGMLYFSTLGTTPTEVTDVTYTMEPGVEDAFLLGHQHAVLDSSDVIINNQDDFEVTFGLTFNDGPANVKVKANDVEIFNQDYTADANETFTYAPPLEHTEYTFDFYLNDTLVPGLTKTLTSPFQNANTTSATSYVVKPNYQPSTGSIPANGEVGASVVINNPSNVPVEGVEFTLKNDQGTELASKFGTIAPNDLNTYEVAFIDQDLDAGTYTIDYKINFNIDPSAGPNQGPLSGTVNVVLTTTIFAAPELTFDQLIVGNHPSFVEGVSNWDNGEATVNYVFDRMALENVIISLDYVLHETTLGQISSGTIDPNTTSGSLSFNNLASGEYYITWDMTWALNGESGTVNHSGQTENITLVEVEQLLPIILSSDLSTTEVYPNLPAQVNGTITLHNFADIIGKNIEITPMLNGSPLTTQTFSVPNDGIIQLSNWEFTSDGDYTFAIKVLDYKINSSQVEADLSIGETDSLTIIEHQFTTPNINSNAERNNETNVLTLSVEALNGTSEKPWIDAEGFNATLTVRYVDGTTQQIPFTDAWENSTWDLNSPTASFDFELNNTEAIDLILISGEFISPLFPNTRSINIINPQVTETNLPVTQSTNSLSTGAIVGISVGAVFLGTLLLWPLILLLIRKVSMKKNQII